MKISDFLLLVRAEVDHPSKWCQGRNEDDAGRCCAVGAIHRVYMKYSKDKNKSDIVVDYDDKRKTHSFILTQIPHTIPAWNDNFKSHQEFIQEFDKMVELAKQNEQKCYYRSSTRSY